MSVSVSQFIEDCQQDLKGNGAIKPRYMALYKNMIMEMDEVLESDKTLAHKFKKAVKCLHNSSTAHVVNEVSYAENMEKLGNIALSREAETGIGSAFLKLSVINKDLANHQKIMCENLNNMILFPLNSLLKGDMNKIGDMKKPVEEAWKEFKSKGMKKDPRKKTSEIVLYRIDPPEVSEESEKERRLFMHTACDYLVKANEIRVKKGVELVQHLIEFYHAQLKYFMRGLELLENMKPYFEGLTGELQQLKVEADEEKKDLSDIRNQLKTMYNLEGSKEGEKSKSYKIHGQQGDKVFGHEKSGTLKKQTEGVVKKWQNRHCVIKDGLFTLAHNSQSAPSTTISLLTCQVKPLQEKDKKLTFCLVSHNRTYLFQAEDEYDYDAWISVLSNAREEALNKAFGSGDGSLSKEPVSSIDELTKEIVSDVKRQPGNSQCVDCNTKDPTWLSSNLGVLVCIECSGIHRELGVHISRIRSLTLDRIVTAELLLARTVGNSDFNEIMEANLDPSCKPNSSSNMDTRKEFIQQKYVQKKFINKSGNTPSYNLEELRKAINRHDILAVLQLYAEGVDFSAPLPNDKSHNTALHYAVEEEDLTSLHIVDFIIQNCKTVDMVNAAGNTPLHIASLTNNTECTKLLIRASANLNLSNKEGKTAFNLADENNNSEIVDLLQDAKDGRFGKFDQIKIDWGLEETHDLYEDPLNLSDLKLQLKDDMLVDATSKKQIKSPATATPGIIQRVATAPKHVMKTTASPTPSSSTTAHAQARHSVAFPTGIQVLPATIPDLTSLQPTNPSPRTEHQAPPPPPARKAGKPKVPIPLPQPGPKPNTSTPSIAPKPSVKDRTSPPPPATPATAMETMVHLGSQSTSLSTFTAKPHATTSKPPTTIPSPTDKTLAAPPPPPTRSSSFIPRGSETPSLPPMRPPDRQPPPAPAPYKKGHNRNQSEGNILYSVEHQHVQGTMSLGGNNRLRTNSVAESQLRRAEPIPIDPDAPPLPPPRPKNKPFENNDTSPTQPTFSLQRTPSYASRMEMKPKYRRAKALYDCEADHDDELSFVEGDVIIMKYESEADWWYGTLENNPEMSGVFPLSFVHVLNE